MGEPRKLDRQLKRNQSAARELRSEVEEQMRGGSDSQPIIKHPNRDQARGDRDRTGKRHDETIDRE